MPISVFSPSVSLRASCVYTCLVCSSCVCALLFGIFTQLEGFFFFFPFEEITSYLQEIAKKEEGIKTRHSLKTTIGYVLPRNQPNLLEYLPGISKVSFLISIALVLRKRKKKKKQNRGRFVWVSAGGPDQDLFLVSQFKKNQKKKLVFIRSSWDEKSSHGPFFSSEIASQVKQDLFLEFWLVGHHFEFWDRPKRKLESADVAESDKRRRSQKGRHFRVSYFSLTAKNWERWGPHKVAGRCRLRKCPDTLGVYSYCLIWLERVSIIWFDVIFGIVWLYNQQQTVSKSPWSSLASDFRIHIWKIHADSFWVVDSTLHLISPAAPRSSDIDDTRPKTTSRIIFGSKYFELIFEFCAVWFFWREELVDQSIMWLTCWIFLCVLVVGRRGNSCCLMRQLRCCCCCLGLGPPCELMMNRTAAVLFCFLFWIVMALYGPASAQDGWDERELHF